VDRRQQSRLLGVLGFSVRGEGAQTNYSISDARVEIGDGSSVVQTVNYAPCNRILSLIVRHRSHGAETQIFAAVAEWGMAPAYFTFRLPTGRYVEYVFEGNKIESPNEHTKPSP
jgi:hypothetical protein